MKFYMLKKEMDRFIEALSFSHAFVKKWMLKLPSLSSRWVKMLQPVHDIKMFFKKQIEERYGIRNRLLLLEKEIQNHFVVY